MSKEIDEKVVEMRFDNEQFEENISTSISSIDKLKKSLQLKDAGKAFEEIEKQSEKIDFSGLSGAIDKVGVKFTSLQIAAYRALENIVDRAMYAGERLIKSLSTDQILAGWTKYEEKTQAVQTIMAATQDSWKESADAMAQLKAGSKDVEYVGDQMQYVNEQIEKLNWFTDETSYNFTDMIDNIGKFTANGVALDKAVTAMQGIATWGATAGAQIPQVGRAMYNLSQALSMGSVQVRDWVSIEGANMATLEFKKMVLETAAEEKTLKKVSDDLYKTMKGTEVTAESMRNSLNEKWFTSDVLVSVLKKYGDFSDKLNEVNIKTEDAGMTATKLLKAIDDYEDGVLDLNKISEQTGVSVEELDEDFKILSSDTMALGRKAFIAAQEAKTFTEAIQATKDAVSTGWMNIFELIFGNYEEAKVLWTTLSNELYDVFAEPLNSMFDLISEWKSLGGKDLMLESIFGKWDENGDFIPDGVWGELKDILETVKQAFHDVFPEATGETLLKITKSFSDFIKKIRDNEKILETIYNIFHGISSGTHLAITGVKSLFQALSPVFNIIKNIAIAMFEGLGTVGKWISSLDDVSKKGKFFEEVSESIKKGLEKITGVFTAASDRAKKFIETFGNPFAKIKDAISKVASFVGSVLNKMWNGISDFFGSVKKFFENGSVLKTFGIGAGGLGFGVIIANIKWFIEYLLNFKQQLSTLFDFSKALTSIQWFFEALEERQLATNILKIAGAIGILALSLFLLSKTEPANLAASVIALTATMKLLVETTKQILAISITKEQRKGLNSVLKTMLAMSVAVLIMSKALKNIASADPEKMIIGVIVLGGIIEILIMAMRSLTKIDMSSGKQLLAAAGSMILIAVAVRLIVGAVRQLGEMDIMTLAKGIASIGLILLEMGAFVKLSGGSTGVFAASAGMILLAISIKIMASSIADIANISWEGIAKGLVAIGGILLILTGILYLIAPIGPLAVAGAAGLLIMGFAVKVLASVLKELSEISKEQIENLKGALKQLGSLLLVMSAALTIASITGPLAIAGAAGFLIMSFALKVVVSALSDLASLKPDQIKNLDVVVDSIGSIMTKIQKVLGHLRFGAKSKAIGSGAFAAVVVGLKGIAWALSDLASLKPDQIKNLDVVVDSIGSIMTKIQKVLGHLRFGAINKALGSGAFAAMSTAMLEIAGSIKMLSEVNNLSDTAETVILFLNKIKNITGIIGALPIYFGRGMKTLSGIGKSMKDFGEAFVSISNAVKGLFQYQRSDPEKLSDTFTTLAIGMGKIGLAIKTYGLTSKLASEAMPNIAAGIKAMSDSIIELETANIDPDKLEGFLNKIGEALAKFGTALKGSPFWFPRTRAEGIGALADKIKILGDGVRSLSDINSTVLDTKLDSIGKVFEKLGTAIGDADGWKPEERASAIAILTGSIKDLAEGLTAFKDAYVDISGLVNGNSQIKEFYAKNFFASMPNIEGNPFDTIMSAIGTGLNTIGTALKEAPVFNVKDKGEGVSEVANSLSEFAKGIKDFSDIGLDASNLENLMNAIGGAITAIGQSIASIKILDANFFRAKAAGLSAVMSAFYDFGNAVKTLVDLTRGNTPAFSSVDNLCGFITTLGTAMAEFGNALNTTDFGLGVGSKADGIVTILENIEKLPPVIKSFADLTSESFDIQDISSVLDYIGEFIREIGSVLGDSGIWGLLASPGIKATSEGIVNIISALDGFSGLLDACKMMDDEAGELKITDFNAIIGTIKRFIIDIGKMFSEFSWFGIGINAKADAIVKVVDTIDTIVKAMVQLENKKINDNFIEDRLTAIKEGINGIAGLTKDLSVIFGDSIKIDMLYRIGQTIQLVSEALSALQTVPSAMNAGSNLQSITATATAVNEFVSEFVVALKDLENVTIDTSTFTACVSAVSELGPAIMSISGISASKVKTVLQDVASALSSFADDTNGSVVMLEKFSQKGKQAATNFVTGYSETISESFSDFNKAGDDVIFQMTEGMKTDTATNKIVTIMKSCVSEIRSYRTAFYNAGVYVGEGYVEGVLSKKGAARNAGGELAKQANIGLRNIAEIQSPSKLFYEDGLYCTTAFIGSFYDSMKDSNLAGKALANNAITGTRYALQQVKAISESNFEFNPRIRPVLDLSDIQSGVSTMNGYFGAAESLSLGTSIRLTAINSSLRNQNGPSKSTTKIDNSDVVAEIRSLRSDMNSMADRVEGMQIAINGKKAIAYLTKQMDRSLGQVESRRKRGV